MNAQRIESPVSRGVYFIANDAVLDLGVAFLNSFRRSNPTLPLCLVPFNASFQKIARLQSRYNFSISTDEEAFRRCDVISERFHGRTLGHYRKLATWNGMFDEFAYVDVDTVVLEPIEPLFRLLADFDFMTSHAFLPWIMKFVWHDSIFTTGRLSHRQISFATNTGFILSKRNMLTLDEAEAKLPVGLELAPHMALECIEQPFLNYLLVTAGKRYSSLLTLRSQDPSRHDIPVERWGGMSLGGPVEDGRILTEKEKVLLVHWAGLGSQAPKGTMPNQELWNYYRNL
jgi:hypothetical protein